MTHCGGCSVSAHSCASSSRLRADTVAVEPALDGWMARRPLRVLENADRWTRLVQAATWMARRPADGTIYLREIPIPGVDTKFIEQNRTILAELIDELDPERADRAFAPNRFAQRYGFAVSPHWCGCAAWTRRDRCIPG